MGQCHHGGPVSSAQTCHCGKPFNGKKGVTTIKTGQVRNTSTAAFSELISCQGLSETYILVDHVNNVFIAVIESKLAVEDTEETDQFGSCGWSLVH